MAEPGKLGKVVGKAAPNAVRAALLAARVVARVQGHILVLAQTRTRTRGSHTFVKQPGSSDQKQHYAD